MRNVLLLILLISVLALSSAMPKECRGRNCRNLRPSRPAPSQTVNTRRPVSVRRPATPTHVPVTGPPVTELPVTEEVPVTEQEMITDTDGEEIREAGVNGWLSAPTPAPVDSELQKRANSSKIDKPGSCDTPKGFGIKCMMRLDQCRTDHHCPGSTKCCMVGECGYLCVKAKPTSTEPKEVTKDLPHKNKKGEKTSAKNKEDMATGSSEIIESVELVEGAVKAEDIIESPQQIEENEDMTEDITEDLEDVEQLKETMKKSGDEMMKEVEKKQEVSIKEVEKVIEEVQEIEEALEEEIVEALEEEIEEAMKEEIEAVLEEQIVEAMEEEIQEALEEKEMETTTQNSFAKEDETPSE